MMLNKKMKLGQADFFNATVKARQTAGIAAPEPSSLMPHCVRFDLL